MPRPRRVPGGSVHLVRKLHLSIYLLTVITMELETFLPLDLEDPAGGVLHLLFGNQARAHFNRNDLKCGYFAASTCPAEEGRSQAPWRSKIACNSAIGTARGAQPRVAAKAAAAPAACPVSQHCGISRRKEWLDGSQEMCRPATSSRSMSRGTRQPYGTEISGNFGDSEGET